MAIWYRGVSIKFIDKVTIPFLIRDVFHQRNLLSEQRIFAAVTLTLANSISLHSFSLLRYTLYRHSACALNNTHTFLSRFFTSKRSNIIFQNIPNIFLSSVLNSVKFKTWIIILQRGVHTRSKSFTDSYQGKENHCVRHSIWSWTKKI